jgi:hypothetical protein
MFIFYLPQEDMKDIRNGETQDIPFDIPDIPGDYGLTFPLTSIEEVEMFDKNLMKNNLSHPPDRGGQRYPRNREYELVIEIGH